MQSLARILASTKVLWPFYVGIIICSLGTAAASLVSPFLIRDATDAIVGAIGDGGGDITDRAVTTVLWLAIGLLIAELAQTVVHNIGGYLGDVMTSRMREILSTRYFAKLLSLPQRYFDDQVTGTIIARLERSITNVTQFLQSFSNNFFPMLLTVFAVLGITGWHYWPLALLLAAVFPTYMWLTTLTSKRWQKIEGKKNAEIDLAGGRFAEVVGQVKVVRSFTAEVREVDGFSRHYEQTVGLTREQLEARRDRVIAKYNEDPNHLGTSKELAGLYEQLEDWHNAHTFYHWAHSLSNGDVALATKAGAMKDRALETDLKNLEAAVAADPDNAELKEALGQRRAERQAEQVDEAQKRVDQNPTDPQLRFELGSALYNIGDHSAAIPHLQQATRNPHIRTKVLLLLGRTFRAKNMYDIAIKQLSDALADLVAMDTTKKEVLYEKGLIHEEMGDKVAALDSFKQIYEVDYGYRDVARRVESSYT